MTRGYDRRVSGTDDQCVARVTESTMNGARVIFKKPDQLLFRLFWLRFRLVTFRSLVLLNFGTPIELGGGC